MKKILLLVFSVSYLFTHAAVLLTETFDYTATTLGESATGWTTTGALTTGTGRTILNSSLSYTNGGGTYVLSETGKTLNHDYLTGPASPAFISYKPFAEVNSGVIFLSYLYKAPAEQTQSQSELLGLSDANTQSGVKPWVGKVATGTFRFGVTRSSTSSVDIQWGSANFNVGEVYLVVVKYDFTSQSASVYVNPSISSSSEPTPVVVDNSMKTAKSTLSYLLLKHVGSSKAVFQVGGIRISTTWAEAVEGKSTLPKLTTPTVGVATSILETSFTANWTAVANATGYDVKVYSGATLVSTKSITGQAATSAVISGLTAGTTYTYSVIAKGNGTTYGDSNSSIASASFSTTGVNAVDFIRTDFGDGTWGTIASTSYASGSYPSSTIKGFNLVKAYLYAGSLTCPTGETHTNRIMVGKASENAVIEFPILKSVGEVEVHAVSGTAGMSFRLEEFVNNAWTILGTYITIKNPDSVYIIPLLRNANTKLRIANNTSSGLVVYKIATKTYQEAVDLNLRSTSPFEGEVCFSNLKKTITLTFNKNVEKVSGTILLNGVSIPLNTCAVAQNVVTIPVTLTTQTGSNKNYTLTVSAGTFAEVGNLSNSTKAVTLNFQAQKSVLYPSNYTGLIDVVYKDVNSVNCRMDVYYPTNAITPVPVVINMHGGGWVSGAKEEQGGFDMYFNKGYAIVNVEYRMRNEILAPAAVEDVRGAMHYALNHAQEWNIDPRKVVFQGGSAGGHLSLTGGYLQNDRIYDNDCIQYTGEIKVMAVIDKYGAADLITFAPGYSGMLAWLGSHSTDEVFMKTLSPVHLITVETPPTYIIHGDADPTIPYAQSVELNAALQTAGVKHKFTTVPGGGHGGFSSAYNTQYENEVIQFLDEVIAGLPTSIDSQTDASNNLIKFNGNQVIVESEGETYTTLYDSRGAEVLRTAQKVLDVSQKGLFIVKVTAGSKTAVTKIFVK
ncbi:MAG: alpha/beta hydrolase fold domain-containing protein [Bacteroidales bacterium]|nr:alpha/beta hydrolase fold domain-containing protein [Bacteroidales bacterium]